MADQSSDSDQELFPIVTYDTNNFVYENPLLVSGILKAVVEDDLEKIKKLIVEGESVNINDKHGNTPLHVAVIRNLSHIVEYLLTVDDIVVNSQNSHGETPLFQAVERNHVHLVDKLITANCNVNLSNFEDITPLHLAMKRPEIALLLINNGANLNSRDNNGETPLHEAVSEENDESVCMLLYHNVDPNIGCDNNITPFMKAIIFEAEEIQQILLDYVVDFNTVTEDGISLLNLALTHCSPLVNEIIDRGADTNYEHNSVNAFIMCLQVPNVDTFKLMWKNFRVQEPITEMSYLELLLDTLSIDQTDIIYEYLRIIIDSSNVEPILLDFSFSPLYDFLIGDSIDKSAWLGITTEIICIYLCHGYSLSSNTIENIYTLYGYNDLLYICLHMDIQIEENLIIDMPRILYDMNKTVDEFKAAVRKLINYVSIRSLALYFRIPNIGPDIVLWNSKQTRDLDEICQLPSLVELARNTARDHLVSSFDLKLSKKYYLFVKHLPINDVYKDILSFRKPIYLINKL